LAFEDGLRRVVITHVTPELDNGRFAVKRAIGETVTVEADVFLDGHDELSCEVTILRPSAWSAATMRPLGNDRWSATFSVDELGRFRYRIEGWPDIFETWRRDLQKRVEAGQDVLVELSVGAQLVRAAAGRASDRDRQRLLDRAGALEKDWDDALRVSIALEDALSELMAKYPDRTHSTLYDKGQEIAVDPERALFSSWYELFPRSTPRSHRPGRFADAIARLPYVASMGFDVLICRPFTDRTTGRKGRTTCRSPRERPVANGIGSELGGHKDINPDQTLAGFASSSPRPRSWLKSPWTRFRCSSDHPYVRGTQVVRPEPDGSIRYAENPPSTRYSPEPRDRGLAGVVQELRGVIEC
jgi:starch synthase (maltosyl-transferring)